MKRESASYGSKSQGSKIARLSAARLAAVQAVYQMKANGQAAGTVIAEFEKHRFGQPVDGNHMVLPDGTLFRSIVGGVGDREDDLAALIEAALKDGKGGGNSAPEPLLMSIMLCGAWELLENHDADGPVIISDYLEVTHAFYEGSEAKLVNGVLDSAGRKLRDMQGARS